MLYENIYYALYENIYYAKTVVHCRFWSCLSWFESGYPNTKKPGVVPGFFCVRIYFLGLAVEIQSEQIASPFFPKQLMGRT